MTNYKGVVSVSTKQVGLVTQPVFGKLVIDLMLLDKQITIAKCAPCIMCGASTDEPSKGVCWNCPDMWAPGVGEQLAAEWTNNIEAKKKIVKNGESRVSQNWHKFTGVCLDAFLEALEWVCADPCNGGRGNQLTREIMCRQDGTIVKLQRVYGLDGMVAFYGLDDNRHYSYANYKAGLSAHDRV